MGAGDFHSHGGQCRGIATEGDLAVTDTVWGQIHTGMPCGDSHNV